jgi:hypothetical protein
VLKLVYQTAAFGAINLEYEKDVVRVGSSEDNDLVLVHPSIRPHHCLLSFWEEKLAVHPPDESAMTSAAARAHFSGATYACGDQLQIGELTFLLGHSANSVAVPEPLAQRPPLLPATEEAAVAPAGPRYYCAHCGTFVPEALLKRIGLVGHTKHLLCPWCSTHVQWDDTATEPTGFLAWLKRLWRWLVKVYTQPPRPRR